LNRAIRISLTLLPAGRRLIRCLRLNPTIAFALFVAHRNNTGTLSGGGDL
jgi:hypothetical protein